MDHNSIASQSQDHIDVQSKIDDFFGCFKIGTLMHRWGVRKHHGHSVRSLTKAILVFVRDRRKKNWLALLSTDTELADEQVVRIYGKRWDIEVFFKMAKQHLKLAKEIQCRDFDALIAHTSIVFMRYMFLTYQCRMETDHRSFGDLFYACCEEVADISFMQSLYRILTLAADQLKQLGAFCEKTAAAFFDAIMETALQCVGLSKNKLVIV